MHAAGSRTGLQEKDAKITSLVEALGNSQALLSTKEAELQGVSLPRAAFAFPYHWYQPFTRINVVLGVGHMSVGSCLSMNPDTSCAVLQVAACL